MLLNHTWFKPPTRPIPPPVSLYRRRSLTWLHAALLIAAMAAPSGVLLVHQGNLVPLVACALQWLPPLQRRQLLSMYTATRRWPSLATSHTPISSLTPPPSWHRHLPHRFDAMFSALTCVCPWFFAQQHTSQPPVHRCHLLGFWQEALNKLVCFALDRRWSSVERSAIDAGLPSATRNMSGQLDDESSPMSLLEGLLEYDYYVLCAVPPLFF